MDNKEELKKRSQERIRELINQCTNGKQQEFADYCDISKFSISQYVNGTNAPGNVSAAKIAKRLRVDPLWVMGFDVPKYPAEEVARMKRLEHTAELLNFKSNFGSEKGKTVSSVRIPVLGRVAAGIPMDAIEEFIDYEDIPEAMARDGEYFALRIKGDSMEPRITDGDVVIVRKQEDADDGDIVIALVNGNDGCCKRLRKYENGSVALISTNPAYDPMYFSGDQVSTTPVRIIGKVRELRAKF